MFNLKWYQWSFSNRADSGCKWWKTLALLRAKGVWWHFILTYRQNFLSHQIGERQVHWSCFHPSREPDGPEQCLSRLAPWIPWIPWIQTGLVLQVWRKEASRKVKLQAGRGRLVARTWSPFQQPSPKLHRGHQSCPVLQVGKAIPDKGNSFIGAGS